MVGLPAVGKTHIATKISRYLSWLGYATRTFEVSALRRERVGIVEPDIFYNPGAFLLVLFVLPFSFITTL